MDAAGQAVAGHGRVLSLTASRAFVDFAVSGLENPLLGLLLVAAARLVQEEASARRDVAFSTVLSLAALTRIDALLLLQRNNRLLDARVAQRTDLSKIEAGHMEPTCGTRCATCLASTRSGWAACMARS